MKHINTNVTAMTQIKSYYDNIVKAAILDFGIDPNYAIAIATAANSALKRRSKKEE